MALQSLTPPQDITWKRMAYSRDMIDTNFGDLAFPPKWRSSLAVYYYIVPEEETADAYPDSKIVYLKLTCSITGWNPSEELQAARKIAESSGALDDLQKSIWEAISSKGWSSIYWPCLGAIMQVAVYPSKDEQVGPDDYPYIMDFEPKKRELYESVSEGGETLSASSEKLSTTKGRTHTVSVELSGGLSFPILSAKVNSAYQYQHQNIATTDNLQEDRTTKSHSTSFSQMYQLFNGYHLGTNRALFLVAPRPHTASSQTQTDFNLIHGDRKLEGIQEMFLVIHMPSKSKGFCVQASLDTGHTVQSSITRTMRMRHQDDNFPDDDDNGTLPPDDPEPPQTVQQLVVTRRIVQNCGKFDENGNFTLIGVGERPTYRPPDVVFEGLVKEAKTIPFTQKTAILADSTINTKAALANQMNMVQNNITKSMVSGISAGNYKQRPFSQTNAFLRMSGFSLGDEKLPIPRLEKLGYIDKDTSQLLTKNRITTLSELFQIDDKRAIEADLKKIRAQLLKKALIK